MSRIFSVLAAVALALLLANLIVGISGGDYNAAARQRLAVGRELNQATASGNEERVAEARDEFRTVAARFRPLQQRHTLHMLLGIAAALMTVLVNSIAATYFIGTSRWCREVVETYQLDSQLAARSNRLKRTTFPWIMTSMLVIIVIVALGGASDPSANVGSSQRWVLFHYITTVAGTGIIAWSFYVQVQRIRANYTVIEAIMDKVQERGGERTREPAM